jgi:hypothetical protein
MIGAPNTPGSAHRRSRHRSARKFSANDCVGAERRGPGLRSDRLPRRRRVRLAAADRALDGASGRIPAAARSTWINRSIETTRTSCSTRSTPPARTRHMTPATPPARAPERECARRAFWSSSRSRPQSRSVRSPPSRCLPHRATAANAAAASPPPAAVRAHAARRPPSGHRRGYDRRRPASASQCRAQRPSPNAVRNSSPASEAAPAPPITSASSAAATLPTAARPARDRRRYCCRRA